MGAPLLKWMKLPSLSPSLDLLPSPSPWKSRCPAQHRAWVCVLSCQSCPYPFFLPKQKQAQGNLNLLFLFC